jgi:hypothetical protein
LAIVSAILGIRRRMNHQPRIALKRVLLPFAAVLLSVGLVACGTTRASDSTVPIQMPDAPPTAVVGEGPANPTLSGESLLESSFDNEAALNGLEFVDFGIPQAASADDKARWVVEEGTLVQRDTGAYRPSPHQAAVLAGDGSWSDVQVSVSFYGTASNSAGIIARRNGDSYYRYAIIPDVNGGRPKQALVKAVDGVETTLVEVIDPGYTLDGWHTLSMRLQGGAITVTLDGVVVVDDVDSTPLPGGQAGIATLAIGGMIFDNLSIHRLP